jgi:plasmid stabilization system protein ParE
VRTDFHPAARRELDDALNWYLDRSPRASERLAIAIDRAVENISDDQMRFPVIGRNLRSCSVDRFPYALVFRIESDKIYVIAVAHAKRRPSYWKDRI